MGVSVRTVIDGRVIELCEGVGVEIVRVQHGARDLDVLFT